MKQLLCFLICLGIGVSAFAQGGGTGAEPPKPNVDPCKCCNDKDGKGDCGPEANWRGHDIVFPDCGGGSGQFEKILYEDTCKNKLILKCNGSAYTLTYNGKEIACCGYDNGGNTFRFKLTKDGCRLHTVIWINEEDKNGTATNQGTPGKYDWNAFTYNCITGELRRCCRESDQPPGKGNLPPGKGQVSPCEGCPSIPDNCP